MSEVERRPEHEISGLEFSHLRGGNMSQTSAPEDYLWHHSEVGVEDGDGYIFSLYETKRVWRHIRRKWLSSLVLEVFPPILDNDQEKRRKVKDFIFDDTEKKKTPNLKNEYRLWQWTDHTTNLDEVKWWERRPWNDPLPHEPGFWPDNGGHIDY